MPGHSLRRRRLLRLIVGGALIDAAVFLALNGYFSTAKFLLTADAQRMGGWFDYFLEHLPLWVVWAGITPFLFWISGRVRMGGGRGPRPLVMHLMISAMTLAIYAVVSLAIGALRADDALIYLTTLPVSRWLYFLLDYQWYWWITLAAHAYHGGREAMTRAREAGALRGKAAELSERLVQAELDTLKAQLQPHFLFNTHNALAGLIRSKQDAAALDLLASLSDFLRYVLENRKRSAVPLARELAFARKYVDIQKVRFGDRLRIEWLIEEGCEQLLVPPLILQPLVENAVHHGVSARRDDNLVRVRATRRGETLEVEIINNTGGEVCDHEGFGIGLVNVHGRLDRLYGADYSLDLELIGDDGGTMRLRMALPLQDRRRP